jgi:integrase
MGSRGFGTWYRRATSRFWWIQYWRDGRAFRESTKSEKVKDAKELLKQRLVETAPPSDTLIVRDLYLALERDYVINGKKSVRNVRSVWKHHLDAAFGDHPAAALDADRISIYVAGRQMKSAKNATINRELAALKRMYKLGKKAGKVRDCPYIPHLEERNVRKGFVKDNQYEALARETGRVGLWLRAMFELGYTYGWRKGELLGMRVAQVDLAERTLRLDAGETKNDEARLVEMTGKVYELLKQCCHGKAAGDRVFTRERDLSGRKVKTPVIVDMRDAWEKATEAAGCAGLLFHDLRRSGVRNMRRNAISEKVAMTISGHKTRSVFERYNIVDRADVHEAVKKIDRASRDREQRELFEQQTMFHVEQFTLSDEELPPKKAPGSIDAEPRRMAKPN